MMGDIAQYTESISSIAPILDTKDLVVPAVTKILQDSSTFFSTFVNLSGVCALVALYYQYGNLAKKADLEPLATKESLKHLATKQSLDSALEPLATKQSLEHLATKQSLEHLATKQSLEHLATKQSLEPFATKESLKQSLEPLATKESVVTLATNFRTGFRNLSGRITNLSESQQSTFDEKLFGMDADIDSNSL